MKSKHEREVRKKNIELFEALKRANDKISLMERECIELRQAGNNFQNAIQLSWLLNFGCRCSKIS